MSRADFRARNLRWLSRHPGLAGAALLLLAGVLAIIVPPGVRSFRNAQLRAELARSRVTLQTRALADYRLTIEDDAATGIIADFCPVAIVEVHGGEVAIVGPGPGSPSSGWNRYADACANHYADFSLDGLLALAETHLDYDAGGVVTEVSVTFDANGIPRRVAVETRNTLWAALTGNPPPPPPAYDMTVLSFETLDPQSP